MDIFHLLIFLVLEKDVYSLFSKNVFDFCAPISIVHFFAPAAAKRLTEI